MKPFSFPAALLFCLLLLSCGSREEKLPILGPEHEPPHTISPFSFTNQDHLTITDTSFHNKIYVADFIFLTCSTICPLMNREMLKVYQAFENDERVMFLSHTIDPEQDSIPLLKKFSEELGVSSRRWHFVTGHKDSIYRIAEQGYFTAAYPDSTEPDGLVHGGGLLLIDKDKHIRGVYDGTNPLETERLIRDIERLIREQF
jgi:protein SCO1/2